MSVALVIKRKVTSLDNRPIRLTPAEKTTLNAITESILSADTIVELSSIPITAQLVENQTNLARVNGKMTFILTPEFPEDTIDLRELYDMLIIQLRQDTAFGPSVWYYKDESGEQAIVPSNEVTTFDHYFKQTDPLEGKLFPPTHIAGIDRSRLTAVHEPMNFVGAHAMVDDGHYRDSNGRLRPVFRARDNVRRFDMFYVYHVNPIVRPDLADTLPASTLVQVNEPMGFYHEQPVELTKLYRVDFEIFYGL